MKKFNLFSTILAVDITNVKPIANPVNKEDTVLGTLPTELIQFYGYVNALKNEADDKLSILSDELNALNKKHMKAHEGGNVSPESCASYHTEATALIDKSKKIRTSVNRYGVFFWHLIREHFELNGEKGENLHLRENWQVVRTAPTFSLTVLLHKSVLGAFGLDPDDLSDCDEEEEDAEKTPTGDNPEYVGAEKPGNNQE